MSKCNGKNKSTKPDVRRGPYCSGTIKPSPGTFEVINKLRDTHFYRSRHRCAKKIRPYVNLNKLQKRKWQGVQEGRRMSKSIVIGIEFDLKKREKKLKERSQERKESRL